MSDHVGEDGLIGGLDDAHFNAHNPKSDQNMYAEHWARTDLGRYML